MHLYNVGSDEAFSIEEVAGCVAAQFPVKIPVEIHGKLEPIKPLELYVPDILRIEKELGLRATLSIQQSIQNTISFYSKDFDITTKRRFFR